MDVEYTLTPQDIVAFNRYHIKTSPASRRSYWGGLLWGTVGIIVIFIIISGWKSWWNAFLVVLTWVLFLILYPLSVQRNINSIGQRMQKEGANKAIWGKHRLMINEQELFEVTEVGESRWRWTGVERVVENEEYIFIYLTTSSAHVIPKRFFNDREQANAFYQGAEKYYNAAHQSTQ